MAAEVNLDRESLPPGPLPPPPPGPAPPPGGAGRACGGREGCGRSTRIHFGFFYQTPALWVVDVSAYGGKAQEIRYKISLRAD